MTFTKLDQADYLNPPRQELSNGGLGIVVALLVRFQIMCVCVLLGVQSSCNVV